MRILLEQGIYDMRNAGQNALLQVAVERIKKNWPDASLEITTFAPMLLKYYFPNTIPVHPGGQYGDMDNNSQFKNLLFSLPYFMVKILLNIREEIWGLKNWSKPFVKDQDNIKESQNGRANKNTFNSLTVDENDDLRKGYDFSNMVREYDLVIATGSQYLTDIAAEAGITVLDRLDAAIQLGIPTAMVGQGIGPIDDPILYARAKAVLPKVDLICVRERLEAPKLLNSLGVSPERVLITGDDAIEIAYRSRTNILGKGIGVSLRNMAYTELSNNNIELIADILKQAADKYKAQLVSLPISLSLHERDDLFIRQLLSGNKNVWFGKYKFQTPQDVINNAQRCRIVISGTFHGAVLALAQGIPVVCLARSASYINKLTGLADLFNPGCYNVHLDDRLLKDKLTNAIDTAWNEAEQVRPSLLEDAARQVEWGEIAYNKILEMYQAKMERNSRVENYEQ